MHNAQGYGYIIQPKQTKNDDVSSRDRDLKIKSYPTEILFEKKCNTSVIDTYKHNTYISKIIEKIVK